MDNWRHGGCRDKSANGSETPGLKAGATLSQLEFSFKFLSWSLSPNWMLLRNISGVTFAPLFLQLIIDPFALWTGIFILFCKLGPLRSKLGPYSTVLPSLLNVLPFSLRRTVPFCVCVSYRAVQTHFFKTWKVGILGFLGFLIFQVKIFTFSSKICKAT